jgi:hypothetical protein
MAQADQTVQNATFPTVRADINDNLAALFSDSSGNTAPSVTVAFQDWIDTSGTNPLWKKRNAANNAWITLGTIDGNDIAFEGTLPSQSGNAGEYLSTDGTVASWEPIPVEVKAWVNFNGTGTVAIRASFNVSSITDNGTGDYTVNFTTALVDANYSALATVADSSDSSTSWATINQSLSPASTASAVRYNLTRGTSGQTAFDSSFVNVAIFR